MGRKRLLRSVGPARVTGIDCAGLDLGGGDLVEVALVYDTSGNTALLAANLPYEMLCVLPRVKYR